jgi:phosphoribosylaminoimidazole (AIR) synthetase
LGEELLRPTHIYVRPVVDLLYRQQVAVRALVNIAGHGFLNLARIESLTAHH